MPSAPLKAQIEAYAHGRVPRALRRRQIVAEARALFTEQGFHGASMDELSARVGVSKPALYKTVGSKDALLALVIDEVEAELSSALADAVIGAPPPARLRAGLLAFFRYVEANRAAWAALMAGPGLQTAPWTEMRQRQAQLVAELLLNSATPAAPFPSEQASQLLAHALNGAVETVALWWQAHPELSPEQLADRLDALFSPTLFALAGQPL